ncbi:Lactate utilization protein A [Paraburkholderia domus]|uniref:Glycolate oxidase iron-sulfur subunit n=1 Tax=Paraburkholderia domus TaxID=2793075 RepID=A0A9N8QVU4_9BURK|nr:glycolate oxidase subunit GlcF [Paraburkholderia domus]MBK5052404.1 glycolate oxidase subunit GlcF [Burkholderia sp. R-70006]MBK5064554.1 glycolate oxidase subunit GlcF [Burkholderia sp. R-70199]MBK5089462.1 glycolate oxidase subunit GlcF [Burkholderia sp. R-69927]MBK5125130.1 glycolate oxidase subunit GlcF [Burkholderia sp. R-69980]MBK5164904.1 glycolate oxidase subunit GlcF [Burkholderia sp. R-70211]MCI0149819.1 glycolate oxidase subunit GlcF [Paraburkholderia sediminicola]
MQTNLADFIRNTPDGDEADAILRNCVHCGFCTATCPTYQILGDELDGPRGRIYLIKQMVEGAAVTRSTQIHLDRCLTCRNCETTCPSGVQYGRLVEIGRKITEEKVTRPLRQRMVRRLLASFVPNSALFTPVMRLGQHFRPLLPRKLRDKVPARQRPLEWPTAKHPRKMLMLAGCVQPSMMPNVNVATARVLDALGVETLIAPEAGCCGAIRLHLGYNDEALDDLRANIDAWWPFIEEGAEAIVMNASGCGATVKEYAHLLRNDPAYAEKARRVTELTRDIAEILPEFEEALVAVSRRRAIHTVAFHPPCTLQHGQQVRGKVEHLLAALGVEVRLPADSHLCCGSAGTYSLTQPKLSYALRDQKLDRLQAQEPQVIVSANVGCIAHLQSGTSTPVAHWIELVEHMLSV